MRKALMYAIGNRTVVVQRGEYFGDRRNDIIITADVQKCLLLSGERSIRQILGGRGGAHRHRKRAARLFLHLSIGIAYLLIERGLQRLRDNPLAYLRARRREPRHVRHIQLVQCGLNTFIQSTLRKKIAIRLRRSGEPARHAHAKLCELADHLTQRSVLAAHARHIADAQIFESDDIRRVHLLIHLFFLGGSCSDDYATTMQ